MVFASSAPQATQMITSANGSSHHIRSAKRVPSTMVSGGGQIRCLQKRRVTSQVVWPR